jgi:hypothetical protein
MGNHPGAPPVKEKSIFLASRDSHVRGSDAYELKNPPDSPPHLACDGAYGSEVAVERTHQSDQIEDKELGWPSPEQPQSEAEEEQSTLDNDHVG